MDGRYGGLSLHGRQRPEEGHVVFEVWKSANGGRHEKPKSMVKNVVKMWLFCHTIDDERKQKIICFLEDIKTYEINESVVKTVADHVNGG